MPKLQASKDKTEGSVKEVYHITVPKTIVKLKGWTKGTILEFKEIDGKVCLIQMVEKE